ncbi:NAD(P)/FAD-dependent oxidoreductase [Lutibaculum baratangense]|uniref:D-amino-acid dehydrogenase n=1 Tax=Lutibaculum baratangense AMV1 TaxID=631454 RepID=V4R647_9HYPH|nr:FAD-binding oxidoreductase [Lutibaculum baratangense]ESR27392.1 D-amino-acid dehydrogenase [Lutibaculum baratangense AMV1]
MSGGAARAGATALVVGAGAIGTATALCLSRNGFATTLVDGLDPGRGCSFGNAGSLSEQAITPMALPGMLRKVPGWLSDPEGPLHVRWGYLPKALPWLVRWVLASRESRAAESAAGLKPLLDGAVDGYRFLLGEARFRELVTRRGQLILWESPAPSRSEAAGHALRERHGVEMRWVSPPEIAELEPRLAPIFARGIFLPRHGQLLDPGAAVAAMADGLRRGGGTVERGEVVRLAPREGGGGRVTLGDGRVLGADIVVVAAGAWSHRLVAQIGIGVPLETERGYHVRFPGATGLASRSIMNADRSFIAAPMAEGLRVGGTVEIAGVDAAPRYERARPLAREACRMFPDLPQAEPLEWMGCRPSLPDSLPVIDRAPGHAGILLAFGHGHLGMTGAPMTARLVADLAAGAPPTIDLAPYRVTRF